MAPLKNIPPFTGFSKELFRFLDELAANNNRDWFAANRERYEKFYLEPSWAYIEAIQSQLGSISSQMVKSSKSGARGTKALMRIYRDTRFSKDKTPYKTNVGISFRHKLLGDIHAPGFYVHLASDECFLVGGIWMPPREALQLIRQTIDEDRLAWKKVIHNKAFTSRFTISGGSLKSAPRGYSLDHPLIEDIRRTSYCAVAPLKRADVLRKDFVDLSIEQFRQTRPLMKFLCDALGIPY